jgi:hypothetical protein
MVEGLTNGSASVQHAAFDVVCPLAQVRMTRVDLAPRVDDADDRFAGPVGRVVAELAQPRAVAERA